MKLSRRIQTAHPTVASRSRRIVLGTSAAAISLLGVACSSGDDTTRDDSGAIVEEGDLSAFSLNVGDCLVGDATGEVSGFEGVPCDQPHDNEVFLTFDMADGDFPGDPAIQAEAEAGCLPAFESFVGTAYEDSIYGLTWLFPTADSWAELDDREIACLVNNFDGTQKTGSAAGTGL